MSHYCPAVDGFDLRASGDVACWTAPGEDFPIARVEAADSGGVDFLRDLLNGQEFKRMRRDLFAHEDRRRIPGAEGGGFSFRAPAGVFCPDRAAYALDVTLLRGDTERASFRVRYLSGLRRVGRRPIKSRNLMRVEVP